MATMKRHVIYLSDEEWEAAKVQAKGYDSTVSAYVRSLVVLAPLHVHLRDVLAGREAGRQFETSLEAVKKQTNASPGELAELASNLLHFGASRPVPKPGRK